MSSPEESSKPQKGLLFGIAAVITAVGTLIGALAAAGVFGGDGDGSTPPGDANTPEAQPIAVVDLGCSPLTLLVGNSVECSPITNGDPARYQWRAPDGMPDESSAANYRVSFVDPGQHEISLEICDATGCSAARTATIEAFEPPVVSEGTLELAVGEFDWADLDVGRVFQSGISTTIGQATEYDLFLAQSPGGLILWGGLPDPVTQVPALSVGEAGEDAPSWLQCRTLAEEATAGGVPVTDAQTRHQCVTTTEGRIARFRVFAFSADEVTIQYKTWEQPG